MVSGSVAIKVGDGHKLHYKEWYDLGIRLSDQWEHISTHMFGNRLLVNSRPERNELVFRRIVENKTVPTEDYMLQNEYEVQKYKNRTI